MELVQALQLYLVTDTTAMNDDEVVALAVHTVEGGVTCVQLRDKTRPPSALHALALSLLKALKPSNTPLIINDHAELAVAVGAQGVHVGQSDTPASTLKGVLPPHMWLGLSVENMAHVHAANQLGVDYLGISPVFDTPTKTDTAPAWGLQGLQDARAATTLPLVAIGGINLGNAPQVLAHGANGLALVSALSAASNPRKAAQQFKALFV
jgi:thiamine-phosphate pyrophosphorylase